MSTHFTAVLTIEKVTATPPTPAPRGGFIDVKPASREVAEIARLVIRSGDLANLREKIGAHAALIEEVPK